MAPGKEQPTSITCPRCRMTSHHPTDVEQGYCGNCHDWTSERPEHYKEAERYLASIDDVKDRDIAFGRMTVAQVHATLALAAATVSTEGDRQPSWRQVIGL